MIIRLQICALFIGLLLVAAAPGQNVPERGTALPRAGSWFSYSCVRAGGGAWTFTDSILKVLSWDDQQRNKVYVRRGTDSQYAVFFERDGDVWLKDGFAVYSRLPAIRIPVGGMQTRIAEPELFIAVRTGSRQGSVPDTITIQRWATYVGEEPIVVAGDTLRCRHVQTHTQERHSAHDAHNRETITVNDIWFARSLGYIVKATTPLFTCVLVRYGH